MLLHVSALECYLQATLFKDYNSLYVNHVVFLRYAVDVPSYLSIFCIAVVSVSYYVCFAYQALPCVPCTYNDHCMN
jgi:hypothetical protein